MNKKLKIEVPTPRDLKALNKEEEYQHARKQYQEWRRNTVEAKMYLATLFVLCRGKCPKCDGDMVLTFAYYTKGNLATLDHVNPLSYTLKHDKTGLQIMCKDCNEKKGSDVELKLPRGFNFFELAKVDIK